MRLIHNMSIMAWLRRLVTAVIFMAAGSFCAYGGDIVGKVVVGYQGWLCAADDGSPVDQWKHCNMECWPSVGEYTTTFSGCPFYQAGVKQSAYTGNLGNGQPAKMFSNWTDQSIDKHFEWMQQYEIDCAAVQRFGSEFGDSAMKSYRNGIANKVKAAAEKYGRKYYIMYDITSWDSFQSQIKTDWTDTMKSHTNSSAYAKEGGKPVVCVWGIGFSDRPGSASSWTDVVNWFKDRNCYVIGGIPGNFRSISNKDAFKTCQMVMAWRVGQTSNFDSLFRDDMTWCNDNGRAYQGNIYPGTSFYNSKTDHTLWPKNMIKRNHGSLMWSQFAAARNRGVQSVYISMFDEVQEATQIFKVAENSSQVPKDKYFLTLDADGTACSSDFYLRLTRDGGKMVKKTTDYVTSHPTSHTSSGTKTVPWVTNMTQSAAGAAITNAGLVVSGVNPEYHATVPAGKIFSQTPGGGTVVPAGSSVALAVSLGPQSQLVLNNSFEANTASWTLAGSAVRSTTTHANSGVASLRINTTTGSATQRVAIVSGKTYDISTYAYVSARTAGQVVFDTGDKYDGAGQGQFVLSAANGGWTKYSGSFTATNTFLTVRMFADGFAGTAYFDQIELKPR